jgi:hypothetical protein
MQKQVKALLYAHPFDMGGLPIRQPFPTNNIDHIGPFILLHHARVKVPTHIPPLQAGVGPHPHRGFSPVSFIFEGGVHHRDSRGNNSVIYAGGTQWTNAGMGLVHSERPPVNIQELGGYQELIQLWVNIPAKNKMDVPSYIPLTAEETPFYQNENKTAKLNVIAGELKGVKGPIPTLSSLTAATLFLENTGKIDIDFDLSHDVVIYILEGELKIVGYGNVSQHNAILFEKEGSSISIEALAASKVLVLSGAEIPEKMVAQGPFVMNSETEIMQAYRDYQMGKMGVLIEE